jgi:hypothetical protein
MLLRIGDIDREVVRKCHSDISLQIRKSTWNGVCA